MMDILFWIGWVAFASVLVGFVYVLLAFVLPARNSAGGVFIKGKRDKMPVVALDDGSRWIFKVAKKQGQGILIDDEGIPIEITPKSLKWGGGVLFGAGEFFRSKIANAKVVDFITKAREENWTDQQLIEKISNIESAVEEEINKIKGENNGTEQREQQPEYTKSRPANPETLLD